VERKSLGNFYNALAATPLSRRHFLSFNFNRFFCEGFNIINQSPSLLRRQVFPGRHRRAGHAARNGVEEVLVGGHTLPGRDESISRRNEVAGLGIEEIGSLAVAATADTMASHALLAVNLFSQRNQLRSGGRRLNVRCLADSGSKNDQQSRSY